MSHVTDTILCFHPLEDEKKRIAEVHECETLNQRYEDGTERIQRFAEPNNLVYKDTVCEKDAEGTIVGGHKWMQHPTYCAAFNHIDVDNLIKHIFEAINWEYPNYVQLFLCDEHDEVYTIYCKSLDLAKPLG